MEYYKAIASIIENATDISQQEPNQQFFKEVAELVKSRSDMPKEAVRNFMIRFSKKSRQIVILTLELIEYCVYACEINFCTALNNKDFLLKITAILSSQSTDQEVKDRVLKLLSVFNKEFQRDIHLIYFQFQEKVTQKGYIIPNNYVSKYKGTRVGVASSAKVSGQQFSQQQQNDTSNNFTNFGNQSSTQNSHYAGVQDPGPVPLKYQAAKEDLMRFKSKILQANKMIDDHNPSNSVQNNTDLMKIMNVLIKSDTKLQELVAQVIDCEAMASFALPLNDDLNTTIERFKILRNGGKPQAFGAEEVEPEILRQIAELEAKENQQKSSTNNQFTDFSNNDNGKSVFDNFQKPSGNNNNDFANFGQKQQQQQQNQQQQQPQQQQDDLLDLLGDLTITTNDNNNNNSSQNQNQNQNQNNGNNNNNIDLFDILDSMPQQNNVQQQQQQQPQMQQQPPQMQQQQSSNSNHSQGLNVQQLYNNQSQQQPQQDKYAALSIAGGYQQQMYNQQGNYGYNANMQQQQQQQQNNNNMNMNMNNNMGMNYNQNNGWNQQQQQHQQQQQQFNNNNMGMGMGMGMGMVSSQGLGSSQPMHNNNGPSNGQWGVNNSSNNNTNNFNKNNNFMPQQQAQQFRPLGMGQNTSNNFNNNISQQQKKDAFDGLDDMFGINVSGQPKPPQKKQSSNQQLQMNNDIGDLI